MLNLGKNAMQALAQSATQNNVVGYNYIGASTGGLAPIFPLSFYSIPKNAIWPYMQQWHLDVQHEFAGHSVMTVSYVGSKGTHLGLVLSLHPAAVDEELCAIHGVLPTHRRA